MLRKIEIALVAPTLALGLLLFGLAGSASALTIADDPLFFTFGSGGQAVDGFVDFLDTSTETQLNMTVTINEGQLDLLSLVACETSDCDANSADPNDREPSGVGTVPGDGVDVTDAFITTISDISFANFEFDTFNARGGKGPDTSDVFFVQYEGDPLQVGDFLRFGFKGKGRNVGTAVTQVVPEPTTLGLLGLGLGGLAFAARAPKRG